MQQNVIIEEVKEKSKINLKSKKFLCSVLLIISTIIISFLGLILFNNKYINNFKICKNVYIGEVNVSNLTYDEAKIIVEKKYKPENIIIKYNNKNFIIDKDKINLKYDTDKFVSKAYYFNKTDSYFKNLKRTISLKRGNKEKIKIKPSCDEKKLELELDRICKNIDEKAIDAKLKISSNKFFIIPEIDGKKVNKKTSIENIKKYLSENKFGGSFLVIETEKSKITSNVLKNIDSLLSSHSTTFKNASYNRAFNITRAANSTSDIVLMPGEEFSYNESTGPRSIENGYKEAPIIVNGKVQNGPGGGVCQVSTTIYNSALNSGLEITDVRNHSLTSTYAPRGKDATVSDGYIDLKFKNPYKHPIYIKNSVYGDIVTSSIYGNSKDMQNISIVTENEGSNNIVNTYRLYKNSDGEVIKREYISTSSYRR